MQTAEAVLDSDTIQRPKATYTFSFYRKPVENLFPSRVLSIKGCFDLIVGNTYKSSTHYLRSIKLKKERSEYKKVHFDYITPNGVFSHRKEVGITNPSGFFIIDKDDIEDTEAVFEALKNDPCLGVVLMFRSPSGNGIKALIKIDTDLIQYEEATNKMGVLWNAVNNYLTATYPLLFAKGIDPSGKDSSRACFLAYDPAAYMNAGESRTIDGAFVRKYFKEDAVKKKSKIVSPKTTLDDLANRHLIDENHNDHLLKFVSAAKAVGYPKDIVHTYIKKRVKIAPGSTRDDDGALTLLIEYIYENYASCDEETIFLTQLSFAFDVLYFKFSKEANTFVLSNLYYAGVLHVLHSFGFYKRYGDETHSIFIREQEGVIMEVTPENMRDVFQGYLKKFVDGIDFTYQNQSYQIPFSAIEEVFLRNAHNLFNDRWMENLQVHTKPILKDSDSEIFFVFKSCVARITADSIDELAPSDLDGRCIWKEQQIEHDFTYIEDERESKFEAFLRNVAGSEKNFPSFITAIGYLTHNYNRASESQAVIFYDQAITDIRTPMGGTGKGLTANAISQVKPTIKIDGKHLDQGNRFRLERIGHGTQVAWFDDVKNDFDFSMLHSNLTDGWTIERKHLPQIFIKPEDSPKVLICSNSILKGEGITNMRRQFVLEFSDYYSKKIKTGLEKPIEEKHGGLFFGKNWDEDEWNLFFSFMSFCAQEFLKHGLIPAEKVNVEKNRLRQKTNEDFADWVEYPGKDDEEKECIKSRFAGDKTEYDTHAEYLKFRNAIYGEDDRKFMQRTFTAFLKAFATYKGWEYKKRESNGKTFFWFSSG
jgi:hypothetical protein